MSQSISRKIPWARPSFGESERRYMLDALESSWISGGPYVDRLERDLAKFHGVKYAATASNGTTAIHMALLALGIEPGDEVLVPGFGFLAAANVAIHLRAKPVFVEVDPSTWCTTAAAVEERISPRTRAIVVIHTYGNVCPMDELVDLAQRRGVALVEDAAESFASRWNGKLAGSFGVCGTLSFQATKTITTGEGGMTLTNDQAVYDRMWLYRNHGMKTRRYWHEVPGHNFRLTNLQAALGCAQFEALEQTIVARENMYRGYARELENVGGVVMQHFLPQVEPVVWAIAVKLDPAAFPQGRDAVIAQLGDEGIETRPGFYSPSQMTHLYGRTSVPICDSLAQQVISLPSFPGITGDEIVHVSQALKALRA